MSTERDGPDLWIVTEYLAGRATHDTTQVIESWRDASVANDRELARLREAWQRTNIVVGGLDTASERAAWHALAARIRNDASVQRDAPRESGRTRHVTFTGLERPSYAWQIWSGVVALALVIAAGLGIYSHQATATFGQPRTVYRTAPGQRATIELADGTVVSLNVASRLEIPAHFGGDHLRLVRLYGEADFQWPMWVGRRSRWRRKGHVTVLGTEFSVRAYQPGHVQVAVRSGRVAVNSAVLGANDIAYVALPATRVRVARHQPLDAAFGFATGRLVLRDTRLREAIPDLDRWYDVNIRLGDAALGEQPVDAVLHTGSIGDLREALQKTFNVRVVQDGRTLTLYPR